MRSIDRVPSGADTGGHIVQFFDGIQSRARAVGGFAAEGLSAGETILIVAQPQHWKPIAECLAAQGHDVNRAIRDERVLVRNAAATLKQFMIGAMPDWPRFDRAMASVVRRLTGKRRLRAYGAMVDLLAAEQNFDAAEELETFWNRLRAEIPFTLFCGYESSHFATRHSAPALETLCGCHTEVRADACDELGSWLLRTNGMRPSRVLN